MALRRGLLTQLGYAGLQSRTFSASSRVLSRPLAASRSLCEYTSVYPPPPALTTLEAMGSMAAKDDFTLLKAQRQIHIKLKSVHNLLAQAEKDPELLRDCEALWVESFDEDDSDEHGLEDRAIFGAKCQALSRVLDITASHGRLQRFDWTWEPGSMDMGQAEILPAVWTSLAANGRSLRSLKVAHTMDEDNQCYEASWAAFPSEEYKNLRQLTLDLKRTHGWDASKLHEMVKKLKHLTSLRLYCPDCCGLAEFALTSHHPNLKSFALTSVVLPNIVKKGDLPGRKFFQRHPGIEFLELQYDQDIYKTDGDVRLGAEDLPNLRAISVRFTPSFKIPLQCRPIEAMEVWWYGSGSDLSLSDPSQLPLKTLKYLFAHYAFDSRNLWPAVLSGFTALREFRFSGSNTIDTDDLKEAVAVLSGIPSCVKSLRALDVQNFYGSDLAEELVGTDCRLDNLKYIGWETWDGKKVYEVLCADGKIKTVNEIAPLRPPTARQLFVDSSILDHFGERALVW